jgi:hypothetical protein
MRRIDKCLNCGDERELVANGFCAKCYMARRREAEKRDEPSWASPDRSQRRYIAERNKMLVNLTKIVKLADETPCICPEDILAIKTVIRPYLLERAESLAPVSKVNTLTQKSELTAMNSTEIDESTDEGELTINSAGAEKDSEMAEPPLEMGKVYLVRQGSRNELQEMIYVGRDDDRYVFMPNGKNTGHAVLAKNAAKVWEQGENGKPTPVNIQNKRVFIKKVTQ